MLPLNKLKSLLNAKHLDHEKLVEFVSERFVQQPETGVAKCSIHDPIARNKAPALEKLYEKIKQSTEKDKTREQS